MMGEGIAVEPTNDVVVAPFDGVVKMLMPNSGHAVGILNKQGIEVLLHIGLETVGLQGEGFNVLVNQGDEIKCGQPLVEIDREFIESKNLPLITMMVVTNPNGYTPNTFNIDQDVSSDTTIMTYTK